MAHQLKYAGISMAVAAAALLAGCATPGSESSMPTAAASTTDLVKCYGVNVCKGHNDCKTADNACGGHATCKGTGFVNTPAKACGDIGGKQG